MQEFLQESRFRSLMDDLGFRCLTAALCTGWFILLWGATAPALLSGAALTELVFLLRRKTRDGRLKRKEEKLRRRIGGEMALEQLLMQEPRRAHFETAVLLSQRCPLTLLQSGSDGVLCRLRQEKVLVSFCPLPAFDAVGPREVMALQRAARERGAVRGILCVPCRITPEAQQQAGGEIPVSFLSRETLLSLFGSASPATDEQLVALGKRRRRRPPVQWLSMIFHPRRAARYAGYGGLLIGMYLLTGLLYYAVPGLICLALAAACQCAKRKEEIL